MTHYTVHATRKQTQSMNNLYASEIGKCFENVTVALLRCMALWASVSSSLLYRKL